ncbi:MAG: phosphopantothenate/pantothenate synthetase [Candidatus Diapherotrites archaeon]|nr:phosphopantothenate/pantothenate synthetase [Candidatus Diapherotrites archaeon]
MNVPKSHPRYASLMQREKLIEGVKKNITAIAGLIAHGRGEAFDYLIGERTTENAKKAIRAAVARMQSSKTVLSVNGNVAVLCPEEYVKLAHLLRAPLEINLFYYRPERINAIRNALLEAGAEEDEILVSNKEYLDIESNRKQANPEGIAKAETVLVPLEDGDRTEALKRAGKFVITIDLNPMSRTARFADITIVDNVIRAVPLMVEYAKERQEEAPFDNKENLREAMQIMKQNLEREPDVTSHPAPS